MKNGLETRANEVMLQYFKNTPEKEGAKEYVVKVLLDEGYGTKLEVEAVVEKIFDEWVEAYYPD